MSRMVFFVLNGFHNGERGVFAYSNKFDGNVMEDGWYWMADDGREEADGPYLSREEAQEASKPTLDDLDVDAILDALWAGKLKPMMADDRMAFADASERALCGQVGDFFVVFDVTPGPGEPPHCEAHLVDEPEQMAIINLQAGTWERA